MLPKIFYRGRFQKLCAIYGARIDLWPDHEQANAHAYVKHCPQKAEADLASALRIDAVIQSFAPGMVSEESQWQALGQLAPNIGLTAVTPEVFSSFATVVEPEIRAPVAEPVAVIFGERAPVPAAAKTADSLAEASLEIREERARMIAKNNKKQTSKGVLKFQ